jgi:hypothetical protein
MTSKKKILNLPPQHALGAHALTFIPHPDTHPPFAIIHIIFTPMAMLADTECKNSLSGTQYRGGWSGLGLFQTRCMRS